VLRCELQYELQLTERGPDRHKMESALGTREPGLNATMPSRLGGHGQRQGCQEAALVSADVPAPAARIEGGAASGGSRPHHTPPERGRPAARCGAAIASVVRFRPNVGRGPPESVELMERMRGYAVLLSLRGREFRRLE